MSERLDPFSVPEKSRVFLYNAILLPWETKKVQIRPEKISHKKILAEVKLRVEYFNTLDQLEEQEKLTLNQANEDEQFLFFHNETKPEFSAGYTCLFKRLRDAVAHAHYELGHGGLITIIHRYSPGKKSPERTRVVGKLTIASLRKLIFFIDLNGLNISVNKNNDLLRSASSLQSDLTDEAVR